jgi:hypothetical protein
MCLSAPIRPPLAHWGQRQWRWLAELGQVWFIQLAHGRLAEAAIENSRMTLLPYSSTGGQTNEVR